MIEEVKAIYPFDWMLAIRMKSTKWPKTWGENMTTPQSILDRLEHQVRNVCDLLEGDEDNIDIVERLKLLEKQQNDLMASQQRMENLMNLIALLLRAITDRQAGEKT